MIFGGGSAAAVLNDVWCLDLDTKRWTQPEISAGSAPAPRAGHASALVGDDWYILGGGDNKAGCTDMLCCDLSALAGGAVAWRHVATVPAGSPLASEGASLL